MDGMMNDTERAAFIEGCWAASEANPLSREARHCRLCDRELVLRDGRAPLALFDEAPPIVEETRSITFDNGQARDVRYRFCDEDHQAKFHRQEAAWRPEPQCPTCGRSRRWQ